MSIQSRREREKQNRIKSIKKAAWKIFLRDGLHKSKMTEIAENCSLGLSTLYYYFKDKRQLTYNLMLDYKTGKHKEHLKLIESGVSKAQFIEGYIDSYLSGIDRFRFFVLADSYYNYHGEYDLNDPVIQEYDRVTHENGNHVLDILSAGLGKEKRDEVHVCLSMILGFLRRYVLLPAISQPRTEEERAVMIATLLEMSLNNLRNTGIDLNSPMDEGAKT